MTRFSLNAGRGRFFEKSETMKNTIRFAALAAILYGAHAAQAAFIINVTNSTVTFQPSGGGNIPFNFTGSQNEHQNFNAGAVPVTIGASTTNTIALVNIDYNVDGTNAYPVTAINLVFTGLVVDWGRISWSETIRDSSNNVVGSASGTVLGGNYTGGANGAFNISRTITLSSAQTIFSVHKSFDMDLNGQQLPTSSTAALGTIEQTLVPEPGTFLAIGAGIATLALRRRYKKA